jgi:hypothetical protein
MWSLPNITAALLGLNSPVHKWACFNFISCPPIGPVSLLVFICPLPVIEDIDALTFYEIYASFEVPPAFYTYGTATRVETLNGCGSNNEGALQLGCLNRMLPRTQQVQVMIA